MRTATTTVGAAIVLAAAGLAVSNATSFAEPGAHTVRYTLTSGDAYDFDLYYLSAQPPSKDVYNADPYKYLQKTSVNVGPDNPWVFETTLDDPQWAIFTVSSTTHGGRGAPNAHCEIAVDGQVANQNDHPYSPRCQLGQW